jgi:hypothetical protein
MSNEAHSANIVLVMNIENIHRTFSQSDLSELRNGTYPTPEISAALTASMLAAEGRLLELSLHSSSGIAQERADLQKLIALASSRLAPIRRLPLKVLSNIFTATMDPTSRIRLGKTPPPHFCAVSSHWRTIALSTPSLWTTFEISPWGGERALRTLELYLSRSQNFPLSVTISGKAGFKGIHCVQRVSRHQDV